ncbi:hypothetical protein BH09BAC6_BH09BAC6_13260 [soil metagenome]|jgi:hypothetical protein
MKTYKKTSASKLVARFDKELMNIIMNDLKTLKTKNQFLNNSCADQLTAA